MRPTRTKKFLNLEKVADLMPGATKALREAMGALWQENRGAKILLVGNTGAGKTSVVNNLLRPYRTLPAGSTREVAEVLAQPTAGGNVVLVDTPGNEQYFHLLGEYLDELAAGRIMGVLNVVTYGYNDPQGRKPESDRPSAYRRQEVNQKYLERQRHDDLRYLDRWLISNELIHESIKWIITVVNKLDLWSDIYEEVLGYYGANGEFGKRVLEVLREGEGTYCVASACAGDMPSSFRARIPHLPTISDNEIRLRNEEFLRKLANHIRA